MRLFAEILRQRVGSPLSLASITRNLQIAPATLKCYLSILEAPCAVFLVKPWHHNIACATLQAPKAYFYETGLVIGDEGVRLENFVACALLKHVEFEYGVKGKEASLHCVRTKDGDQVDFAISEIPPFGIEVRDLIECEVTDVKAHAALIRFTAQQPETASARLVGDLRQPRELELVSVRPAADWLARLSA